MSERSSNSCWNESETMFSNTLDHFEKRIEGMAIGGCVDSRFSGGVALGSSVLTTGLGSQGVTGGFLNESFLDEGGE
jgi:hypothetical protein